MNIIPTIIDPQKLDPKNYVTIGNTSYIQFKANSYNGVVTTGIIPEISSNSANKDDIIIDLYSELRRSDVPIYIKNYVTITTEDGNYYTLHSSLFKYLVFRDEISEEMTINDYLKYTWNLVSFKNPKYSFAFFGLLMSSISLSIFVIKSILNLFNL